MASTSTQWILELVDKITAPLRKVTEAAGQASSVVDDVDESVNGLGNASETAAGKLEKLGKGMFFLNQVKEGVDNIRGAFNDAIEPGIRFETAVAEMSGITNMAGKELDVLADKARGTAKTFGTDAADAMGVYKDLLSKITMILTLTAGACIVMWMGEKITEKGIGNGVSLIIFVGIVARLPVTVWSFLQNIFAGEVNAWALVPIVVIYVAIVAGVVFIDCGERRIPVQYAKRVVGRKMYGGQTTNIPMKINSAGVMPIIFAVTLLQFPGMIASFWPQSGFALWWGRWMNSATVWYNIIFAILIVALGYFYNMVTFNPVEVSKNIQQYGGFIPGIRPGKPTSDYLAKISSRLTMFGGLFLAALATLPGLIAGLVGTNIMALTATGILISVSVALETSKQLESQMLMRHYKGFLK